VSIVWRGDKKVNEEEKRAYSRRAEEEIWPKRRVPLNKIEGQRRTLRGGATLGEVG